MNFLIFALLSVLVISDYLPISHDFSNAENIARDPDYPIYSNGDKNWRIVKLTTWKILPKVPGGVPHTAIAVADDQWYLENVRNGAVGYDIGMYSTKEKTAPPYLTEEELKEWYADEAKKRKQEQRMRIEVDLQPKRFKDFKVEPICYTDKSHDDIKEFLNNYRGSYMSFANNCVHLSHRLLKFLCGKELAKKTALKYLHWSAKCFGPFEKLKYVKKKHQDYEWYVQEMKTKDGFKQEQREHEEKLKQFAEANPEKYQEWLKTSQPE